MIRAVDGGTLLSHDLHLLESLEFKQRIKHIVEIIEAVKWEDIDPDMLTRFVSSLWSLLLVLISSFFSSFHIFVIMF